MSNLKEIIISELSSIQREGIDKLIDYISNETDYFLCPASTKYHSNYEEGLSIHSHLVTQLFREKNERYNLGLSDDTIKICGYGHDLCKTNFYTKGIKNIKEGKKFGWNGKEVDNWVEKEVWEINDMFPAGHGSKSVILLQKFIQLTEFEILAILFHMGVPEDYEMKQAYNKAVEKYPAIIALHTSDYEASYLLETIKK